MKIDGDAGSILTGTKRELLSRAKHEAGHAIYAMTIDVEFKDVTIVPYQPTRPMYSIGSREPVTGEALGGLRYEAGTISYANDFEWAGLYMAGLGGERIDRKTSGRFTSVDLFGGAHDDWQHARAEAKKNVETGKAVDEWINRALAAAWKRLRIHRDAHANLVNILLEKGTVTYAEVEDIYDEEFEAFIRA